MYVCGLDVVERVLHVCASVIRIEGGWFKRGGHSAMFRRVA